MPPLEAEAMKEALPLYITRHFEDFFRGMPDGKCWSCKGQIEGVKRIGRTFYIIPCAHQIRTSEEQN